jgi:DNA-binding NtrC family response regulator
LEREVSQLRARVSADAPLTGLVGTSQVMERLRETLRRVALSDRPALIVGPTGAGKEVVARTLHALGPNPDAPLLEVNCGAFAENLIESELFGHEKGAFTGADQKKPGYFSSVGKGTLFLDEIAELPMSLQTRLLRVLESGRYRPVGANAQEQRFEGRVVAATHADLLERVREKRFREDLYFRLNVLMVKVPALDEHREDIPALLAHFLKQQRRPLTFTPAAVELLMQQSWSGNVRQLRSLIDRIAVMSDSDTVTPEVIGQMTDTAVVSAHDQLRALARTALVLPIAGDRLDALGSALIDEAMTMCAGNKSAAARVLGVHRKVVERRLGGNGDEGSGKE